jgi:hypothetical protein
MNEMQRNHMPLLLKMHLILKLMTTLLSYRLLTIYINRSIHQKPSAKNYPGINIKEF